MFSVKGIDLSHYFQKFRVLVEKLSRGGRLQILKNVVLTDVHWTRRQLREVLGWPDKRLRACLDELVSLEYLQTLDGCKGKAFIYRLNPDFSHNPKALGLLTPEQLQAKLEQNPSPQTSKA